MYEFPRQTLSDVKCLAVPASPKNFVMRFVEGNGGDLVLVVFRGVSPA